MKAVFIDKDGTLVEDRNDAYKIEDVVFFPNTFEALKILKENNFELFIVTNQNGIARGLFKRKDIENQLDFILKTLKEQGIEVKGYSYCPHETKDGCNCRKPKPGMLISLISKYNIEKERSFMIGDKTTDIEAGKRAGVKTILVKTGKSGLDNELDITPDFIGEDLYGAAKRIATLK